VSGGGILVITGCTASGKTAALEILASRLDLEVVSADSRQIYRGMDIGTAKPSRDLLGRVPHHVLDIMDPDGVYSAGRFAEDAASAIESVRARGRTPLVVGGTVLYLLALLGGLDDLPRAHPAARRVLLDMESSDPGCLLRMLARLDPVSAVRLGSRDLVRILRALEISLVAGMPASTLRKGGSGGVRSRILVLDPGPAELRRRISARTGLMLEQGLVEETRTLLEAGFGRRSAPGSTLGYDRVLDMLEGTLDATELQDRIEADTWRFARRQRNMMRRLGPVSTWDGLDAGPVLAALAELEE